MRDLKTRVMRSILMNYWKELGVFAVARECFYQKITDIYAQCSIDYDPNSLETKTFFATVQNKLHRAITKQTAAEIIHSRVDKDKPNI